MLPRDRSDRRASLPDRHADTRPLRAVTRTAPIGSADGKGQAVRATPTVDPVLTTRSQTSAGVAPRLLPSSFAVLFPEVSSSRRGMKAPARQADYGLTCSEGALRENRNGTRCDAGRAARVSRRGSDDRPDQWVRD